MSSLADKGMVTLREVPGKGEGLIATQKILKGTRILCEEPIIRIPEDTPDSPALRAFIRRQVDELTSDQRRAFLAMCNIYPGDAASQYLGIIRTNALPIASGIGRPAYIDIHRNSGPHIDIQISGRNYLDIDISR